jgi:hypothetical protein
MKFSVFYNNSLKTFGSQLVCKLCTGSLKNFLIVWFRTVVGYFATFPCDFNWFLAFQRNMVTS